MFTVNPWFIDLNPTYSLRCFFFLDFRLCPDFFALSRSMFLRAIKAVISRQPEPLYFSDFFILRFITSVLIFLLESKRRCGGPRQCSNSLAQKNTFIWKLLTNVSIASKCVPQYTYCFCRNVYLIAYICCILANLWILKCIVEYMRGELYWLNISKH